ncbi:acyltransferase [Actinoplanes oblitus]|uniref:Acyltransferase n=1 Tax=Actinoplanes oblitus TaxID=3040509 RepID=A0ABY8WBL8_9ACTN|nr:acyltransferase [Actinoplanes oblitus]WIM93794.1 acyltransferase [Actinoplanes oblitus]
MSSVIIKPRLAWLDALRGFAALVVVLFHLSPIAIGAENHAVMGRYFDMGKYGVLLFFLVSGYVIPMSLERHGSPRKFWIGRLFRIYPAYLISVALFVALIAAGVFTFPRSLARESTAGLLGHATMLQEFVGARSLVRPFWTLSFEMTFYLIVAGLFVWGLHRFSAWWAAGLILVAAVGGTGLPKNLLGATVGDRRYLAVLLALLVGVSLLAYVSGRRWLVLPAGLLGLCFVALPLLNGHSTKYGIANSSWQATFMLAVMFAGTVIYRAQHGQLSRWAAVPVLALVAAGVALTTWLSVGGRYELIKWCATTAAVVITFAIGFALRERRVPAVLVWLGAVSYSLYLLHSVILHGLQHVAPESALDNLLGRAAFSVAFGILTLGGAWLSYRYVEQPGQNLGRRVQQWVDARLGPDAWRRPVTVPAPARPVEAGEAAVASSPM